MPAASSASIAGSPRSWPRSTITLPLASTASAASVRAYAEVSTYGSRIRRAVGAALGEVDDDAALGAAVVLADDDVLRDVHQTTGQVARVGGTQRGVRQTLAGAVGVDEVLQHRQALAEGGLDRTRDELALGVGHQTLHAGQRAGLGEVTRGARLHDRDDRVVLGVVGAQRVTDLLGGLLPQLHQSVVALLLVQRTALVLLLDAVGFALVTLEDLRPSPAAPARRPSTP